jgi:hypothetical protein
VRFAKTHDKHNTLPCVFRRRRAKLTTVRRRFPQPTLMSHGVARGVHVHTCLPCIFMCNARQRGLFAKRPWFCARQSFWRTTMVEFPVVKKTICYLWQLEIQTGQSPACPLTRSLITAPRPASSARRHPLDLRRRSRGLPRRCPPTSPCRHLSLNEILHNMYVWTMQWNIKIKNICDIKMFDRFPTDK